MNAAQIKEVRRMTRRNEHGAAYLYIAKALGQTTLAEAFARINSEHRRLGYLTPDLNGQRYAAYKSMMAQARLALHPVVYQELYEAT